MSNVSQADCNRKCWTGGAVVGALVFLALWIGGYGFFPALVLGVIATGLLGALLVWLACGDTPRATPAGDSRTSVSGTAAAASTSAAASPAAAVVTPTPPAEPEPGPAPVSEQEAIAEKAEIDAAPEQGTDSDDAPAADTPAPVDTATAEDADKAKAGPLIKPSRPLAGQDELASRKGSWKYQGK